MLTLISGLPGNGKTLYAIQYVRDWAKREGRQVYYHGIKGLSEELGWKLLSTQMEPLDGKNLPPRPVPQWWLCPAGAIIVIDEAQNCGFGSRQRGDSPEWSRLLETHRHMGVDIVFITQNPGLIDAHDRVLIELHFHVMRTFGMQRAVIHEFKPVKVDVLKSRKGSLQKRWSYPTDIFKLYTSAELHTHKRRIPPRVFVFMALPFVIGGISWTAWRYYLDPHRKDAHTVVSVDGAASGPGGAAALRGPRGPRETKAEYVAKFVPRVDGLDYTAPVYDEVTKPVAAPYPAACVMTEKRCQCYTQQATRLGTTEDLCRQIAAGGFFVAWQQPVQQSAPIRLADASPVPYAQPQGDSQGFGQPWGRVTARPSLGAGQESASVLTPDRGSTGPQPSGRGRALPPTTQPNNDNTGAR